MTSFRATLAALIFAVGWVGVALAQTTTCYRAYYGSSTAPQYTGPTWEAVAQAYAAGSSRPAGNNIVGAVVTFQSCTKSGAPTSVTSAGCTFNVKSTAPTNTPNWCDSAGGACTGSNQTYTFFSQTTPCPQNCDQAAASAEATFSVSGSSGGQPDTICDSVSHCRSKAYGVGVTLASSGSWAGTYRVTAEACSAADSPGTNNGTQERCTTGASGLVYCANPTTPQGQCGWINDTYTCLSNVGANACKSIASGGLACSATAGTPPAPDNGTPGTKAAPTDKLAVKKGDGAGGKSLSTVDFFNQAKVSGSSRPAGTGSTGSDGSSASGTGDGTGEEEGDEDKGVVSGGGSCAAGPPSCEGNVIECAILRQSYAQACPTGTNSLETAVEGAIGGLPSLISEDVDVSEFDESIVGGGANQCPQDATITVFGQEVKLFILSWICLLAAKLKPVTLILAYLQAARIVFAGGGKA